MAKGISIHIGLNKVDPGHYQGWSGPLNACIADAEDMQAIAETKGFTAHPFHTEKATRHNVMTAIKDAAGHLDAGDILFMSYSGHGGQVPDANDDEPDGQDETWCLYDGELIDDELYNLFRAFRAGVRILVLSDSCHSGSVTRDAFLGALRSSGALAAMTAGEGETLPAVRAMPMAVAMRTYRAHKAFYTELQAKIPPNIKHAVEASVTLISGCKDNQTSSDGTFNGLFTANLLRVWNKGTFKGGYEAFHKAILARMPPVQSPELFRVGKHDLAFDAQRPFTV